MTRPLRLTLFLMLALGTVLGGCSSEEQAIDLNVYAATYDTDPTAEPPEG